MQGVPHERHHYFHPVVVPVTGSKTWWCAQCGTTLIATSAIALMDLKGSHLCAISGSSFFASGQLKLF